MEEKLKMLFDYQRFERNGHLESLIHDTETYYARELSDEDLFMVSAAGDISEMESIKNQETEIKP